MFILDSNDIPKNLDSRYTLYINGRFNDSADFPNEFLDIIEEYPGDDCKIIYEKYLDGKWVYLHTVEYTV